MANQLLLGLINSKDCFLSTNQSERKMKRKLLLSILTMLFVSLFMPFTVEADITWNTELYEVSTYTSTDAGGPVMSDYDSGPPLPISAYSESAFYDPLNEEWYRATATADMTDSSVYLSFSILHNGLNSASGRFTGTYTAVDPYFVFSYDFSQPMPVNSSQNLSINIQDLSTSTTLYDSAIYWQSNQSDVIFIPTTLGNDIRVFFNYTPLYSGRSTWTNTLNYSMSSSTVVPEPVSMVLFATGGAVLAGRRYIKRKKNA